MRVPGRPVPTHSVGTAVRVHTALLAWRLASGVSAWVPGRAGSSRGASLGGRGSQLVF